MLTGSSASVARGWWSHHFCVSQISNLIIASKSNNIVEGQVYLAIARIRGVVALDLVPQFPFHALRFVSELKP